MKYVFYTTDGFTEDMNNKSIENCQILGFANGSSIEGAYNNFLLENGYLKDYTYHNILALEIKGTPIHI